MWNFRYFYTKYTAARVPSYFVFHHGETPDPHLLGKGNDMAYAIYRHSKHKNLGTVTASSRHMTREATTPNADPARADQNQILIGSEDPAADVAALVPALDAVDEDGKKRRRKNPLSRWKSS